MNNVIMNRGAAFLIWRRGLPDWGAQPYVMASTISHKIMHIIELLCIKRQPSLWPECTEFVDQTCMYGMACA